MMPASQLTILCALTEGPATGYAILKRMRVQTKGNAALVPKNIYSRNGGVEMLASKGWIDIHIDGEGRKVYYLTPVGAEIIRSEVLNLESMTEVCLSALRNIFIQHAATAARAEQPMA